MASKPSIPPANDPRPRSRDLSRSHDDGQVLTEADRKWMEENREAMAEWEAWVEKNGVPLPPQF